MFNAKSVIQVRRNCQGNWKWFAPRVFLISGWFGKIRNMSVNKKNNNLLFANFTHLLINCVKHILNYVMDIFIILISNWDVKGVLIHRGFGCQMGPDPQKNPSVPHTYKYIIAPLYYLNKFLHIFPCILTYD